ncbi:NADH-quinone oxidoreductase subunit J [Mycolicibacterium cosmeticum]|uniref:NADH-quinone oxidoreductase subunit J n=1 Tax=Mycolicibacterium cosmeticum TaxID=258533 RepID=W9AK39_MYCCO|nr:NADH-quinone oxidoreductase subunit J [Mycolicibacterium cosmeticum]TLH72475.1 NADH-quinone oxidoreductase subunit J [Mycolicibacterium cosmeticum]CDO05843.1 NADH dehydrogenase subunit J [Mycolicibacterium cosmeticum]
MTLLAAPALAATSTGETAMFWILAPVAVIGAVGTVMATRAVYSAMLLGMTMLVLAVLYVALDAAFLGVVQVVVYTGAVMMLFLFVLMLVGVDRHESLRETIRRHRPLSLLAATGFTLLLVVSIGHAQPTAPTESDRSASDGNLHGLATMIFTRYFWVFELTGALMITAALAAMVLVHRERFETRKTQREMAIERFRTGGRPTPLPSPGVYAQHNAVDMPARLPDGSAAAGSVAGATPPRNIPPHEADTPAPKPPLRLVTSMSQRDTAWVDRWAATGGVPRNGRVPNGGGPLDGDGR